MASSTTIVSDVGASVAQRLDDYDKLAGYEAFRRIKDNFEEPPRPSIHDVESVAAILRDAADYTLSQDALAIEDGHAVMQTVEGRTHRISLSPGIIRRRTFDAAKLEATLERQQQAKRQKVDVLAAGCGSCPIRELFPVETAGTGAEIKVWSAKSRVRMLVAVASLDYSEWLRTEGTLAMVTLTLPDQWEILAPDGATFKKLIEKFRRRWTRATGLPWRLLWKLEFQGRGAPHWHALMRVPVFVKGRIFTEWLSETWADVCGASKEVDRWDKGTDQGSSEYTRHVGAGTRVDFSGKDFSDPRRISQYFLGHSAKTTDGKEYQHDVPELWQEKGKGPGRFWGYCGLDKAVVELDVTEEQKVILDRQLRKIKRARDWKINVLREQGTAKRTGARIPAVHEVMVKSRGRRPVKGEKAVRRGVKVAKHLKPLHVEGNGRAAHRTANRRSLAAHQLGYTDVPPAVGIGPVWRVSNLVSVPPAVGIGPANLVLPPWAPRRRSAYAPFSRGQGGFVLVNDALRLGLDLAAYLRSCG